jgi:hypothetical protein
MQDELILIESQWIATLALRRQIMVSFYFQSQTVILEMRYKR